MKSNMLKVMKKIYFFFYKLFTFGFFYTRQMDDVMDDQYVDQMDGNIMYEDDQFIDVSMYAVNFY